MIEVKNLVKRYGYITALRGLSFTVSEGEILGLVGPNGAGKTTTLKSIIGLIVPDHGEVLVDGVNPLLNPEIKRFIGYVPELPDAPEWARVCDLLEKLALLEGTSTMEARRRAREALEMLGVEDLCNRKIKHTSKGQRKRILFAQALLNDRRYLILDEPITGLDPEWVARAREIMLGLANSGVGVLVSSHILRELQDIVDRVVIISKGRKVFEGKLKELSEKVGALGVVIIKTDNVGKAREILEEHGYKIISSTGKTLKISAKDASVSRAILELLEVSGISVESFEYRESSLEDAYLKLIREGE